MNAPIPFSDWVRIVRPIGADEAHIAMLTGYFDDSGTHGPSRVVVWAGFFAPETNWLALDRDWRAILARDGLDSFHMKDCMAREKAFERWKEADCNKVVHDLRQAIKNAALYGIGVAVPRADWHEVTDGHAMQKLFGTPEEFAFSGCFYHALNAAQEFRPETEVSLVFDDRDLITQSMENIVKHYKRAADASPKLVSVSFQKCSRFSGLQAADMLAWETYRYALQWVDEGAPPLMARPHFQDLIAWARLRGSFMDKEQIRKQINSAMPRTDVEAPSR